MRNLMYAIRARFARNRLAQAASMFLASMVLVGSGAGVASAQTTTPADPTGGAAESTLSNIQGWITSHGGPLVVGLLVIGLTFAVLIKFAKRGTKSA